MLTESNQDKIWNCPKDIDCSLTVKKCDKMKYCNGNGDCNDNTGGRCNCTEGFYGADCSIQISNLTTGPLKILPKDVQVYKVVNYYDNILLEIDSEDKNVEVSLLNKKEHDHLFNPAKHAVTYKLVTHKLILYIEKELLDNCVIVIRNLDLLHDIKLKVFINYYSKLLLNYYRLPEVFILGSWRIWIFHWNFFVCSWFVLFRFCMLYLQKI